MSDTVPPVEGSHLMSYDFPAVIPVQSELVKPLGSAASANRGEANRATRV